jgi:hypothetical protein
VFDVPRDLEDHMATHDSIWMLLPALSMQWVYAYDRFQFRFIWNIHWHLYPTSCLYFSCLLLYYNVS